jgi:hypothetical protein
MQTTKSGIRRSEMGDYHKDGLTITVDDRYTVTFPGMPDNLPDRRNNENIQWVANVNVTLRRGEKGFKGAKFKVTYEDAEKQLVYFKKGVRNIPPDKMLPVGDPPIGIIR